MTRAELLDLASVSTTLPLVPECASALGISPNSAYALAKRGEFPIRVLHVGRKLKVASADLLRYLGLDA